MSQVILDFGFGTRPAFSDSAFIAGFQEAEFRISTRLPKRSGRGCVRTCDTYLIRVRGCYKLCVIVLPVLNNLIMSSIETIDNLNLIENGLVHIEFELGRDDPSYFRIARESHLILYRSMIEALKGSANLAVTGRPSRNKNRSRKYKVGDQPWKEIHKVSVPGCKQGWRFSEPVVCDPPKLEGTKNPQRFSDDHLISFYDALAMIQCECFTLRSIHRKVVPVSDHEMQILEWLHEEIRNEYEHFVPRYYAAPISDLLQPSESSLRLSTELIFKSNNVLLMNGCKRMQGLAENLTLQIQFRMNAFTTHGKTTNAQQ